MTPSLKQRCRVVAPLLVSCFGLTADTGKADQNQLPQYSREAWDSSRGYPGGRIFGLTQTTNGYLWIGTDRGLVRFDGSTFRVFSHTPHSAIESVFALAGDRRGNLLISTVLGIQRLQLRNEELDELPALPDQPSDPVAGIYPENGGTILIATVRHGIIIYDGAAFMPLQATHFNVTAAVRARDGAVWMGTATQGLFGNLDQSFDPPQKLDHLRISALLPFRDHGLWIGTDRGVLQWDGASARGSPLGPARIEAMLEDRHGTLWLGSAEGLYRVGSDRPGRPVLPYSRDVVTSIYEDREGDVWAGASNGIVRFRRQILTTYALDPFTREGGGGPLFIDSRGAVWCAKPDHGIVRIVDGVVEPVFETGPFTSVAIAGTNLWLGQQDGTLLKAEVSAPKGRVSLKEKRQLGRPIIALFQNREGVLWIGMQNAGLAEIITATPSFTQARKDSN